MSWGLLLRLHQGIPEASSMSMAGSITVLEVPIVAPVRAVGFEGITNWHC